MWYTIFWAAFAAFTAYRINNWYQTRNSTPAPVDVNKGKKVIEEIKAFCEIFEIPADIIKNLVDNYDQYCNECAIYSGKLKDIDFDQLAEDIFGLSDVNLARLKEKFLYELQTANSYVTQFNAIHTLVTSAQNSFEDYINQNEPSLPEEPANDVQDNQDDEDLKKAIALSLEAEEEKKQVPEPISEPLVQEDPLKQKETMRITMQLSHVFKIPADQVSDCVQALQAQKSWKDPFEALRAYENSTKAYSAEALLAFIALGPQSKAIIPNFKNQIASGTIQVEQVKQHKNLSTEVKRP